MFCVVKTVENKKVFFTTVPEIWVEDNVLYFPDNEGDWKQLRKKLVRPEMGWKKYACALRKSGFEKLEQALQYEKKLVEFADTEDEEAYYSRIRDKRQHPFQMIQAESRGGEYNSRFSTDLVSKTDEPYLVTSEDETTLATHAEINTSYNLDTEPYDGENQVLYVLEEQSNFKENDGITIQTEEAASPSTHSMNVELDSVKEYMQTEFAKLHTKVDKLLEMMEDRLSLPCQMPGTSAYTDNTNESLEMKFPVSSVEELLELNDKLIDPNLFNSLVKKFSEMYLKTGWEGKRAAYALIKRLVERMVLWGR